MPGPTPGKVKAFKNLASVRRQVGNDLKRLDDAFPLGEDPTRDAKIGPVKLAYAKFLAELMAKTGIEARLIELERARRTPDGHLKSDQSDEERLAALTAGEQQ